MKVCVNLNARPKITEYVLATRSDDDFGNRKILSLRMFAMEQCRGDPYFISDFYRGCRNSVFHSLLLFFCLPILLQNFMKNIKSRRLHHSVQLRYGSAHRRRSFPELSIPPNRSR
jgi:hypothetical protein